MAGAGGKGRLYITEKLWVPQDPVERFNLRMADRIRRAMPELPVAGDDAVALFPELDALRRNHSAIRAELEQVLKVRERIPNLQDVHPRDDRISSNRWLTYVMMLWGHEIEANLARCPGTRAVLRRIPRLHTALFSILEPRGEIPRHRGWAAGVVRCHYPLITPADESRCWMEIGEHRVHWREGEVLLFDDTRHHEVRNETDELRVVLIADFEPRLPALAWLYSKFRYHVVRSSEEIRAIATRSAVEA